MARRRRGEDKENLERWLLTYADLITLLLAFFIVMYSMSRIDAKKFGKMSEALSGALHGGQAAIRVGDDLGMAPGKGVLKVGHLMTIGRKIQDKFSIIDRKLGRPENERPVSTEVTERGLVIHIMESALFESGSAELHTRAKETLDLIAVDLTDVKNHIRVEGHTDNLPISTDKFPSNWELSSARATEVVKYLIENHRIPPGKVSALGYGEYRPIRPNNNPENQAKNRRVDVVVLTRELSAAEPTGLLYGKK